jgi:DNA-binding beta-propeller fold protein YncE
MSRGFRTHSGNGLRRLALGAATATLLLAVAAPAARAAPFAYVATLGHDQATRYISQYDAGASGLLAPLSPPAVPCDCAPVDIAVSPDGKSVYLSDFSQIEQYDVGPGGTLAPKSPLTVPAEDAWGLAVSPDGRTVYVTGIYSNNVSQYDVGPRGALTPKSAATVPTGANTPVELAVTPDGRSAYVVNWGVFGVTGEEITEGVSQYDVGTDGALSPKSPLLVDDGLRNSPTDLVVSPDGKSVYVANGRGVSQYDVGAGGKLLPKSPARVPAGATLTGVAVTPDGQSVYVTRYNQAVGGSVLQYNVEAGGRLSPKSPARVGTGFQPQDVAISPDGESVYVVNRYPLNTVSQYDVGVGGQLSPKHPATVTTDNDPYSVALRPPPTSHKQCNHRGWRQFGFESKRQCMRSVKHGPKKQAAGLRE